MIPRTAYIRKRNIHRLVLERKTLIAFDINCKSCRLPADSNKDGINILYFSAREAWTYYEDTRNSLWSSSVPTMTGVATTGPLAIRLLVVGQVETRP